jgi:UDP-3-O-[3-hydroxymyristoyl] glucosamine N-acyltransferase
LTIGDDAIIQGQAGITNHVPARAIVIGSPAVTKRDFLVQQLNIKRLPKVVKELKDLKQQVAALTEKLNSRPQ